MGKLWTFQHPNGSKTQIDYTLMKRWKNSCIDSGARNNFDTVNSDHRIISTTIRLSFRANNKKSDKVLPYFWNAPTKNRNVRNACSMVVKINLRLVKKKMNQILLTPRTIILSWHITRQWKCAYH